MRELGRQKLLSRQWLAIIVWMSCFCSYHARGRILLVSLTMNRCMKKQVDLLLYAIQCGCRYARSSVFVGHQLNALNMSACEIICLVSTGWYSHAAPRERKTGVSECKILNTCTSKPAILTFHTIQNSILRAGGRTMSPCNSVIGYQISMSWILITVPSRYYCVGY